MRRSAKHSVGRPALLLAALSASAAVAAQTPAPPSPASDPTSAAEVDINAVTPKGIGTPVAKAQIRQASKGLEFAVLAWAVPTGEHGFHVHENGSCDPKEKDGVMEAAGAAGGHYDPEKTSKHHGPGGAGHKGDLPRMTIAGTGEQRVTFTVAGLTLEEIRGRALVIHEKGDTYADTPPMGGGGKRIACGIIP